MKNQYQLKLSKCTTIIPTKGFGDEILIVDNSICIKSNINSYSYNQFTIEGFDDIIINSITCGKYIFIITNYGKMYKIYIDELIVEYIDCNNSIFDLSGLIYYHDKIYIINNNHLLKLQDGKFIPVCNINRFMFKADEFMADFTINNQKYTLLNFPLSQIPSIISSNTPYTFNTEYVVQDQFGNIIEL